MKLLTKEIINKMPLPEEVITNDDAPIIVKFFGGSSYSLYVIAAYAWVGDYEERKLSDINGCEVEDINFYGYVTGLQFDEWGYTTLNQLKAIKFPPFGLGIERDMYFGKQTVKQIINKETS
jgi:hypothetical protein